MEIPENDILLESVPIGNQIYIRLEHYPTGSIVAASHKDEYIAKELAYEKLVNKLKQIKYES